MASIVGKKGIPTCILVRKEEVRGWVDGWREGRRERVENREEAKRENEKVNFHELKYTFLRPLTLFCCCCFIAQVAAHINVHHSHPQYLSDLRLAETITSSADPKVGAEGGSEGRREKIWCGRSSGRYLLDLLEMRVGSR
jgi:hypothetical protein